MLCLHDRLVYRACIEGVTGWSIDRAGDGATHQGTAMALYDQLQNAVLPRCYTEPMPWRAMMKQAIGNIGYYFRPHDGATRPEAYLR
jgi:hypothetical protein